VELMIVVVILAILAAVAIPAFTRYVKRSKTSEAAENLSNIYNLQSMYYQRSSETLAMAAGQFMEAAPQPGTVPVGARVLGDWSQSNWAALGFASDRAVYYSYAVVTSGTAGSSVATLNAFGDLDGDMTSSTFRRVASVNGEGNVGSSALSMINELE
jgi:type II secretory pathway pseudopilin PulG